MTDADDFVQMHIEAYETELLDPADRTAMVILTWGEYAALVEAAKNPACTRWHPITDTNPGPGTWVITDGDDVWLDERSDDGAWMDLADDALGATHYLPLRLPEPPESDDAD